MITFNILRSKSIKISSDWLNHPSNNNDVINITKELISDDPNATESYIATFNFSLFKHKANATPEMYNEDFETFESCYDSNYPQEIENPEYRFLTYSYKKDLYKIKINKQEQNLIFEKFLEYKILDLKKPIDIHFVWRLCLGLEVDDTYGGRPSNQRELKSKDWTGIHIMGNVFIDDLPENKQSINDFYNWFDTRYNPMLLEMKDGVYIHKVESYEAEAK